MDLDVIREISPDDDMYSGEAKNWYFSAGELALKRIISAIDAANKKDVSRILDLPSGYGRVLRYLAAYFPRAEIFACDTNTGAVDFCSATFGACGVYSNPDLNRIDLDYEFDLIWCGSMFTHFGERKWEELLSFFYSHLESGGVLVFTTHGRVATHLLRQRNPVYGLTETQICEVLKAYDKCGFGYVNYDDRYPYYGISMTSPSWLVRFIEQYRTLRIVSLNEHAWGHQDVCSVVKTEAIYG